MLTYGENEQSTRFALTILVICKNLPIDLKPTYCNEKLRLI